MILTTNIGLRRRKISIRRKSGNAAQYDASLDGAISGSPVSLTPSVPFFGGKFTAPAGIDNDVAEAKARPRFVFNQIHEPPRRIIVGHDLKCGAIIVKSALVLAQQCKASIRLVHVVNQRDHFHAPTLPTSGQRVMKS